MNAKLLCLGEPLVEFNRRTDGTPVQGFGGDVSNCAVAAQRSGLSSAVWTAIGSDRFGDALLEMWIKEGVSTGLVRRRGDAPTGVYFVEHDEMGHHFTYERAGSAASLMQWQPECKNDLAEYDILHLSGISQAISGSACDFGVCAIESARAQGITVSYDTNLRLALWPLSRARAVIMAAVGMSDIVLPGFDDAVLLTGLEDPNAVVSAILSTGPKIVALTLGAQGALIATPNRRELIAAPKVGAIDATGAGDCFDGAFLAEWHRTGDPFAAGRYAVLAAALSTTRTGAVSAIPHRVEIEKRFFS